MSDAAANQRMGRAPIATLGLLVAVVSLASCGGSTVTEGPALPSTGVSPSGSDVPSDAAVSEMVVIRTGGFAGVHDTLQIAADGTAQITAKTGETYRCTPDPSALDRLQAIDLAAVGSGLTKSPIADGFTYSVTSASGSASASDGDNEGIRAEFVAAASGVVTSCLANQSGAGSSDQ
jgi:hypothetical protein